MDQVSPGFELQMESFWLSVLCWAQSLRAWQSTFFREPPKDLLYAFDMIVHSTKLFRSFEWMFMSSLST